MNGRRDPAAGANVSGALDFIPRAVRDKLDRVGIKLHLREWQALRLDERERLCDLPCDTPPEAARYASAVETLLLRRTGKLPDRLTAGR